MNIEALAAKFEPIPCLNRREGDFGRRAIIGPHAEFVELAVIVGAKALEEAIDETLTLIRTVGELMAVEMINPSRDHHVLEDIERRREPLNEIIKKIIVGVRAIVKERAEGGLPFLSLQYAVGVRLAGVKTEEVH